MKKNEYKELVLRLLFLEEQDVITASSDDSADDMGSWNDDWFKKQG
jgi:hypothetical protein